MAGLTVEKLQQIVDAYTDGLLKVAANQEWSYQGRTYRKADAKAMQEILDWADAKIKQLERGGVRVRGAIAL